MKHRVKTLAVGGGPCLFREGKSGEELGALSEGSTPRRSPEMSGPFEGKES